MIVDAVRAVRSSSGSTIDTTGNRLLSVDSRAIDGWAQGPDPGFGAGLLTLDTLFGGNAGSDRAGPE